MSGISSWWALFSKIKFGVSLGAQSTEQSSLGTKRHLFPPPGSHLRGPVLNGQICNRLYVVFSPMAAPGIEVMFLENAPRGILPGVLVEVEGVVSIFSEAHMTLNCGGALWGVSPLPGPARACGGHGPPRTCHRGAGPAGAASDPAPSSGPADCAGFRHSPVGRPGSTVTVGSPRAPSRMIQGCATPPRFLTR